MRSLSLLLVSLLIFPQGMAQAAASASAPKRVAYAKGTRVATGPTATRAPSSTKNTPQPSTTTTAAPAPAYVPPPQPATPATPEEIFIDPPSGKAPPKKASLVGWKKQTQFGVWYHHFDVELDGRPLSQPGLLSGMGSFGTDYHFDPFYLGFNTNVFLPQILFKSVGLGIYYFFCFFVTAGKCKSDASFGTGERDAGYIGIGGHVGWNFHPVPIRLFAGPDFGFFYSGLTPNPFSTFFVKGGAAFDFSDAFALSLELRRSATMNAWDFGGAGRSQKAALWMISLSAVLRETN